MNLLLAAVAVTAALCIRPCPAQAAPGWSGFERILWVDRQNRRDDAFWRAVKATGFTAVSVSRGADVTVPARFGLRTYLDQVAGKGILELRDEQWEPVQERHFAEREPGGVARPNCLADPATIAALVAAIDGGLAAASGAEPIAASLGDEASATRRGNPVDVCGTPAFRAAFVEHLTRVHGDVSALNRRWGTNYRSFSQVEPWTTERIRARELVGPSLPRNLAPWSDQLDFTEALFAAAVQRGLAAIAERAPDLPAGLTGMQPPTAFGGHDFARLLPGMRFYEVYDLGGARELADAWAHPAAHEVATLFPPGSHEPAAMVDARLGALVAHGMSGVIVWSASDVIGTGTAPTAYGQRVARVLERLAPAADVFAGARVRHSPVLLVESRASVRAHWMLDSWADGDTWPRRLSSHEAKHGTSMQARRSWVKLLQDLGLQPDFVADQDLAQRLRADPPRLLVLPAILALSDDAVEAVRQWVHAGGHVLADHGLVRYDDALRRHEVPPLDALFGLGTRSTLRDDQLVRDARGSDDARLPSGVAVAEAGIEGGLGASADGAPGMVHVEARPGRGRTTLLNLAVCEYAALRLDPARVAAARDLRRRVQRAVHAAGVRPPAVVHGEGLPTCIERVELTSREGRRLLAVRVAAADAPDLMRVLGERGARPVEIEVPAAVRLRDLVTGEEIAPVDGDGRSFRARLGPWEPLLLEVLAP